MLKKSLVLGISILVSICSYSSVAAQVTEVAPAAVPAPDAHKPIITKYRTLEGIRFFHSGKLLGKLSDYQDIISPLHDAECDRLLKLSESAEDSGVLLMAGAGVMLVGGITVGVADPYRGGTLDSQQTVGAIIGLASMIPLYVGVFKIAEAETSKFAAVQRYNAVIHGDDLNELSRSRPGIHMDLLAFKF